MAVMVNIQPTESTVVRYVRDPHNPPALVITDGPATVWFSPEDTPAGAALAVEFAARLVQTAGRWHQACTALVPPASGRHYLPGGG